MNKYVSVILKDNNNHIILQKREAKPNIYYPDFWGIFGGKIEVQETILEAAVREIKEELDLQLYDVQIIKEYRFTLNRIDILCVENKIINLTKIRLNEGEAFEAFSYEEILKLKKIVPSDRKMLEEYILNQTVNLL